MSEKSEILKFSVIMPVYNVEDYLERSVNYIISQTYENWELILVNDGSKDMSPQIIDKYALDNEKIIAIHQINQGSGVARQNGINHANGDYLCFVDPDDYLDVGALQRYFEVLSNERVDILMLGYNELKQQMNFSPYVNRHLPTISGLFNRLNFQSEFFNFNQVGPRPVWNKTYKASFISKNNIKFTSQKVGQDALFNLNAYKFIESIYILQESYYYYDTTRDGSAVKKYNKNRFDFELNIANHYSELLNGFENDNYKKSLLYLEYWNCIFVEVRNLNFAACPLSKNEKVQRIKDICEIDIFTEIFNNLNEKKIKNKLSRMLFLLLRKRHYILGLQLVNAYVKYKKR